MFAIPGDGAAANKFKRGTWYRACSLREQDRVTRIASRKARREGPELPQQITLARYLDVSGFFPLIPFQGLSPMHFREAESKRRDFVCVSRSVISSALGRTRPSLESFSSSRRSAFYYSSAGVSNIDPSPCRALAASSKTKTRTVTAIKAMCSMKRCFRDVNGNPQQINQEFWQFCHLLYRYRISIGDIIIGS